MSTVPKPVSVQSAMLGVDTFDGCCSVLRLAKRHLSEILSSFEFLDCETMTLLDERLGLKPVLQSNPRFTILVETSGSSAAHDSEKMEKFLSHCISSGLASDGVQAQSMEESSAMWRLRESAPLAVAADGFVYKNDVTLPLKNFYRLTEVSTSREILFVSLWIGNVEVTFQEIRARCSSLAKHIVTYGHLGDGNSHLNITAKEPNQELYDR
ncbi:FAD linked oxidase protein [Cooperia oncophora]